ncbi:sensor histidine kinase [Fimbriiglobus ruber]|uniref:histidine kinase n=1 Tax=Fimbriiglobus ruber TaxID=1908690 RepID=A0A225EDJ9_9BACT|nr:ATP-binding protein [Fimbriiglobus ruber]OWK46407.1 Signal transduction histidine kinase [Fimbriiglobus ruber]
MSPGSLRPYRPAILSLLLVGVVFVVDLNLPLGVASAVPYTFAVLLAVNAPFRWFGHAVAAGCVVLTIAKMEIVPERGTTEMWKVIVNRALACFSISMTLFLGVLRRRAESRRARAEERAQAHMADLARLGRLTTAGQLATGIAHELNQPLTAVCLQAEMAERFAALGDDGRESLFECLREIADQSQRSAEIVRTLRRSLRREPPTPAAVDLAEVILSVVRLIDWQIRRADAELQLHFMAGLSVVIGHRVQLEQVVMNLVQNAIEAIADRNDGPRVVRIETAADGPARVAVTVSDTGIGLPMSGADQVFERFFTTKSDGMGMGLAISRSIVEAHGGRLVARSGVEQGAVFMFSLPVERGSGSGR